MEAKLTIIYIDECGYTGQDLLNRDQPFFVLASLMLDEQEAIELKQRFFSKVQAKELKHSSLSKSKSQQQMIYDFLKHIKERNSILKVGVIHKEYALVCKIVDFLVEPAAKMYGVDLYNKGGNIAMANIFFNGLPVVTSKKFSSDLLLLFQQMLRLKTLESYEKFFRLAFQKQEISTGSELMAFIHGAHHMIGPALLDDLPENVLDVASTLALLIMGTWRKNIKGNIILVHDASSNMAKQKHIWDAITSPAIPSTIVGWDRRKISFPISLERTILESSENWAGLQLTDVVAGAFARCAKWYFGNQHPLDDYGRTITELIGEVTILPVLPGKGVTPSELDTLGDNAEDAHDFIGGIIRDIRHYRN